MFKRNLEILYNHDAYSIIVTKVGKETFYGDNHSRGEIREFVNKHAYNETSKGGCLFWLLNKRKTTYTAVYDCKGLREATRTPLFNRQNPEPPSMPDGKYRRDRKGRSHRVR